jgi:hypothetical protein
MRMVPALFVAVVLVAGTLGGMVATFYSEPMNRFFRRSSAMQTANLASQVDARAAALGKN